MMSFGPLLDFIFPVLVWNGIVKVSDSSVNWLEPYFSLLV